MVTPPPIGAYSRGAAWSVVEQQAYHEGDGAQHEGVEAVRLAKAWTRRCPPTAPTPCGRALTLRPGADAPVCASALPWFSHVARRERPHLFPSSNALILSLSKDRDVAHGHATTYQRLL